ncbi:MAG TPA: hypothetical protein VG271_02785, partial [Beijerinckiaceae bacterium]|nr:hypothetical protein [Beijerinckiaceae bacterium]
GEDDLWNRLDVECRHCEERSDEAIQPFCALRLSGLLRFARNDEAPHPSFADANDTFSQREKGDSRRSPSC